MTVEIRSLRSLPLLFVAFGVACDDERGIDGPTAYVPPTSQGTPPGGTVRSDCDGAAARDLVVSSDDLNGYPPYALAECNLVYVSGAGELLLRDLSTGSEVSLASASEKPRRPSASIDASAPTARLVIVWEATIDDVPVVRVRHGERLSTVRGDFVAATEPRVRGHFVVFTAWRTAASGDDTDVWLYDMLTGAARVAIGGPGQQRFADVSSTHVVATDFSEDPDGRFDGLNDLADIAVFEIASGALSVRRAPGKQAFPMLSNQGSLAYLSWEAIHPEPKLEAYALRAGPLLGDPSLDRTIATVEYVSAEPARPALAGATIEWIANPDGVTTLYRAPADSSAPPVRAAGLDNLELHAPAPSSGTDAPFTLLAATSTAGTDSAPRLRVVAR